MHHLPSRCNLQSSRSSCKWTLIHEISRDHNITILTNFNIKLDLTIAKFVPCDMHDCENRISKQMAGSIVTIKHATGHRLYTCQKSNSMQSRKMLELVSSQNHCCDHLFLHHQPCDISSYPPSVVVVRPPLAIFI
jgi:hypothetical protein